MDHTSFPALLHIRGCNELLADTTLLRREEAGLGEEAAARPATAGTDVACCSSSDEWLSTRLPKNLGAVHDNKNHKSDAAIALSAFDRSVD